MPLYRLTLSGFFEFVFSSSFLSGTDKTIIFQKTETYICIYPKKHYLCTALVKKTTHWRDGRVIDCSGLENRRTARYRGFESLSLRKIAKTFSDKER